MLKHISFIISVLVLSLSLQGQRLIVTSASNRGPIENVAVFNSSRHLSTITDSLGILDLGVFSPVDTLVFQHPSYETLVIPMHKLIGNSTISLAPKNIMIDEFVISASKSKESKLVIPYMVDVLEEADLQRSTSMTAADILESRGNVLVQRTQGGGGSPILRGFEANKVLLVVDGVRLNNAIYRSGHLQNSITIDQGILERTEVIFGPSSIIYGSDALGGVIHYYTRDPQLAKDKKQHIRGNTYAMFASANRSLNTHVDIEVGKKHWAFLTSATHKHLGDIRMGTRRDPTLGDWGKNMHYVDQVNGLDSTLSNPDPLHQRNTGYDQLDLLQKIRYSPSKYVDWILNMQYSTSTNIHRLDKLNDYSDEQLKYAEYYYGPQNRILLSLKNVLKKDKLLFTNVSTIIAFQRIDEDRISRKFRVDDRLAQEEDVYVYSLNTDLLKMWNKEHKLNYGLELNHNRVASDAWYRNIVSGEQWAAQTRYPEGGSLTWSASAYASYKWIMGERMVLNGGARYSYSGLHSSFTAGILPYDRIEIANGALTGSLGMVYKPSGKWKLNTILSTGFRNPNVDDYGKVRAKDDIITVPNESIAPEYSYNAEIGIQRIMEGYMKIGLVAYYSYLQDAIVRTWYSLNGQDSLEYDGDMYRIAANYNAGEAYIYGVSLQLDATLNKNLSMMGTFNYTQGHNISDDAPLGHIPPIFGRAGISYKNNRFFLDTYMVYNGWKKAEEFSPYGEDNDAEAMEYGYPSWWTLNMKTGYQLGQHLDLIFALENILDHFYKVHASGISAPGRNMILSARFSF